MKKIKILSVLLMLCVMLMGCAGSSTPTLIDKPNYLPCVIYENDTWGSAYYGYVSNEDVDKILNKDVFIVKIYNPFEESENYITFNTENLKNILVNDEDVIYENETLYHDWLN